MTGRNGRRSPAECARVAVVGDDLEADVAGGRQAGLTTILVLTGNTAPEEVSAATPQPDYVVRDLAALVEPLEEMTSAPRRVADAEAAPEL